MRRAMVAVAVLALLCVAAPSLAQSGNDAGIPSPAFAGTMPAVEALGPGADAVDGAAQDALAADPQALGDTVGETVGDGAAAVDQALPDTVGVPQLPGVDVDVQVDTPIGDVGTSPQDDPALDARSRGFSERVSEATGIPEAAVAPTLGAVALAGLVSLLAAARSAFGFSRVVRWLPVSLPLLGLFSRIEEDQLLANPVRAQVLEAVAQSPGLSLQEVRLRVGIAWGTAVHHLQRLESHGKVTSVRQGGHRRYFAANTPASLQRASVSALLQPTVRRIASYVAARPGTDQTTLCRELGVLAPSASKHLGSLERQGLVMVLKEGRSRRYHPSEALGKALGIVQGPAVDVTMRSTSPEVPTPTMGTTPSAASAMPA